MNEIDWNAAFDNMGSVAGSAQLPGQWQAAAEAFRAETPGIETDIPYGDAPRQRFDLIHPEGPASGLVVFVHGGYWMRLEKGFWTHLARGARAHGWAVAMPSYTLAPQARISAITREIAAAIAAAAARVAGPVRITGHSAGGHLVARMACADSPLPGDVQERVARIVSISGLHDLHPLMRTRMNDVLQLDDAEAQAESPALLPPLAATRVSAWAGGAELPEFRRQARLLAESWQGRNGETSCHIAQGRNHFTILDDFADPDGPILRDLLGDQG